MFVSGAEASHAGITVESCATVLSALELAMFGRTLASEAAWRQREAQAISNVISNPFFLSL